MNTVWIVLPVLIALMFQLGIELDRQAFAGVARRPAAVVAGLLGQLALLPLIAFGVGLAFRLPPVYFLGLLLVACCPGGSSSNVFSMLAKGDVALSVTLTALSSLITLFTIPLVMGFAARFVAVHAGAAIELPVGKLLVQNIVLLFLPMLCGALFRHWRPRAARRVHELLGRVAFPALMLLAAVFFVQYASTILENLGVLGLAAGALILLAMAGGSLLARLFRLRRAVHGAAGALHLKLQGIAISALGSGAVGHGLPLGVGQLTGLFRCGRSLLGTLLYRRLGCGGRLLGHNGALADMPSLGRAHGLLHGAAAGILFGQLLGAAAGSLILLLIQPARCTAGIQLTRFAHYISSLLCGVFLFKVCFCILISGDAFRVQRAALFFHKINAALECVAKSPVQILHFQRAQVVYAGPVALGAGHIGQIDDLIELGHSRLAGSMAADGRQNFRVGDAPLRFGQDGGGDAVPDRRRTRGGIFCYYSIIGKNLQQLLLGQFLGGIVQNCRHSGLFRVCAPAPGKFYSHFFYIFRVRPALFAQAGLDQLLGFGVIHGVFPSPDWL